MNNLFTDKKVAHGIDATYEAFFQQKIVKRNFILQNKPEIRLLQLADGSKWVSKMLQQAGWLGETSAKNIEFTELTAKFVADALNATVAAVRWQKDNSIATFSNQSYLLTPFINGKIISPWNMTHAYVLGKLLAQIHQLSIPWDIAKPFPRINLIDNYPACIKEDIIACNQFDLYRLDEYIVSHRDLHSANVLWNKFNMPLLIDWESAGLIHPFVDLIGLAVNCAGVNEHQFLEHKFKATLQGYRLVAGNLPQANSKLWRKCLHSWLLWLTYNQQRGNLCEAERTFTIINYLKSLMPEMKTHYQAYSS